MSDEEEVTGSSRAAGGCVVAGLAVLPIGVVFAVSPDAGVVVLWVSGAVGVYVAARRRMSDSSATPPPEGPDPDFDESAGAGLAGSEGADSREGMSIIEDPDRPGHWIVHHHYRQEAPRG